MREFMDYVRNVFLDTTGWNIDNSYSTLTSTARSILDFEIPRGVRLDVSSRASSTFSTSYSLGSVGLVHGSFAYLYSSLPLNDLDRTADVNIRDVVPSYVRLQGLRLPEHSRWAQQNRRRRESLLYGRMFLPSTAIEALYIRRLNASQQIRLSCVSDSRLKNNGTILAQFQNDIGKYSSEILFSTDEALMGLRGLYNFGPDPRKPSIPLEKERFGRLSAGAEVYYGVRDKSGGISTGMRFSTLPEHKGVPLTMTLTMNPLMGSISSTYAVQAGKALTMCSRLDFNVYSYESDLVLGCELWRKKRDTDVPHAVSVASTLEDYPDDGVLSQYDNTIAGAFRAKVDQNLKIGLLWEGRLKDLLFTLGSSIDLRRKDQMFQGIGVEVQYCS